MARSRITCCNAFYVALFLFLAYFVYVTRPDQPSLFLTRLNQNAPGVEQRVAWWDGRDTEEEQSCLDHNESSKSPIPHVVHYIHLGTKEKPASIPYRTYLAIKAAIIRMKPDQIKLHIYRDGFDTSNIWWQALSEYVTLVEHDRDSMHGPHNRPLEEFLVQHQADFLRLDILYEEGGIYLDTDVFPLKSFAGILSNDRDIVMGHEGGNRYGLGNAVIAARPRSKFVRKWIDSYSTFNKWVWNYHSIRLPKLLQVENPNLICALGPSAFFWPTWAAVHHPFMHSPLSEDEIVELHEQMAEYKGAMFANQLAIHLKVGVEPEDRMLEETRFNILMRDVLDAPLP
jgi:hypothetical protein